ncbi:hypothetical protein llap_4525 [Limosa lapponica baueri]|uniref:Secreted protein n=1 Tax=Limosa lapponica baueri TaxID=1758121 RepID=A0A2I0UGM4_LIMLA|nr:hypothetical protein llap_4525 [Limosa lapponica baueri]
MPLVKFTHMVLAFITTLITDKPSRNAGGPWNRSQTDLVFWLLVSQRTRDTRSLAQPQQSLKFLKQNVKNKTSEGTKRVPGRI